MNESSQRQKVVTLIVNIEKQKEDMFEYPELNSMFNEGMYIESFNQCRLSDKRYGITFVLRNYHSA